ncbi:MAG: transketolase C-terminal domain-containing protein, partial [Clostridium sp.]
IIHTITQKGKGYALAEKSPCKYHGVSPFDLESGESKNSHKNSYSKAFGQSLIKLAREDKRITAITAAMPDGTGLNSFSKEFKDRFFDVGIAEQHAVTLAAGMASNGLKPVFAVYSTFLQRGFDQVIHDVCIQNLPVVFAVDRAGIVGEDGETHQGIMDISYLSLIPNMTIVAPKCIDEVEILLKWAFEKNSPVAIRYPRGGDIIDNISPIDEVRYGKWEIINKGSKTCIIATGKMVQHAVYAKDMLYEQGINPTIVNATFIKPIDKELIKEIADKGYNIMTIEDNILKGGLGSCVRDYLLEIGYTGKIKSLGYDDEFVPQGKVDVLYKAYKLDCESIRKSILELYD